MSKNPIILLNFPKYYLNNNKTGFYKILIAKIYKSNDTTQIIDSIFKYSYWNW